ncbi:MAG: PqqD family protein [Thermoanaerobaculia bacterium]
MDEDQTKYVRAGEFATRQIAGQTVVVPVRGRVGDLSRIFTLNETGSAIWSMFDAPCGASELAGALAETFEVTPARARVDVEEYLGFLQTQGLIRKSTGEASE